MLLFPLSPGVRMKSALLCLLLQLPFIHLVIIFTLSIYFRHLDLFSKGNLWTSSVSIT